MNLPNIPFELIFIALFFVLPALSNLLSKRRAPPQERPPTGRRTGQTGRSGQPGGQPGEAPLTRRDPTTGGSAASAEGADEALRRRLEEARRRVQEAQAQEGGRRAQGSAQSASARPLVSGRTPQPAPRSATQPPSRAPDRSVTPRTRPQRTSAQAPPTPPRGQRPTTRASTGAATPPARSAGTPQGGLGAPLDDAPPLRVQRLGAAERATISWQAQQGLFADRRAIMQGFIWQQVLSPPRAKQPRRTRTSRRLP